MKVALEFLMREIAISNIRFLHYISQKSEIMFNLGMVKVSPRMLSFHAWLILSVLLSYNFRIWLLPETGQDENISHVVLSEMSDPSPDPFSQ